MNTTNLKRGGFLAVAMASSLVLSACGGQSAGDASPTSTAAPLTGPVAIDGSSTVSPLAEAAADLFGETQPGVNVTVATSGTGGGFKTFCAGETDISNASRAIKDEEAQTCADAGIEYTEIVIANDGLSVVVNPTNDWAQCLTVEQLTMIWEPAAEGTVTNWNQIDPSFPDLALTLYGPGTDSGTFDYFTKAINGEEGASRADYSASEDDNVLVQGVAGDEGGLGYFGLSYAVENADIITPIEVDGGAGCVAPSVETVQGGTYSPLSRPLFIYVKNSSYLDMPQVKAFVDFFVANSLDAADIAGLVGLTDAEIATSVEELATLG